MNNALKATLDIVYELAYSSDIKMKRNFADFLADRIVQATTKHTLLATIERLACLLNSKDINVCETLVPFMSAINGPDDNNVLNWLREYPKISSMIVMQKKEDYLKCIEKIEIKNFTKEKGVAIVPPNPDIQIILKCLSPLAHGSDIKAGNATIFRRMQLLSSSGEILTLPFYAGNAFRGMMRDILSDSFLSELGFFPRKDNPPCNLWFFHALYCGGALEENSEGAKALGKKMGNDGAVKTSGASEFRKMIPPISLLGSALGNRIVPGKCNFVDFRPACTEWGNGNKTVGDLFEWTYLTRREDHENHKQGENSSMIANTECLKAGTILYGGIDFDLANDLEKSCLAAGLEIFKKLGYIGAENRRGLGKVDVEIKSGTFPDKKIYLEYMKKNKEKIIEYLIEINALAKGGTENASSDDDSEINSELF